MSFYISRQREYPSNELFVECAVGGKKYAGKDILTVKYGEDRNLVDARDAINVAERVYKKWNNDNGDERKRLKITDGKTFVVYDFDAAGLKKAREWAEKVFQNTTKCGSCGKSMGNRPKYEIEDIKNTVFDSEACLARKYRDMFGVEPPTVHSDKDKKLMAKAGKAKKTP